jgi:hypothetical protein
MRLIVATFALALAACTPPSTNADAPADSATAADSAVTPTAVSVDAALLGGMWSFERSCGKSDLVFTNTGATFYDYTDPNNVIAYNGTFAIAGGNHVELLLHRLDNGSPTGPALTYNLDVTAPVTADLVGTFGPAGGAAQTINAKQCASEVHD